MGDTSSGPNVQGPVQPRSTLGSLWAKVVAANIWAKVVAANIWAKVVAANIWAKVVAAIIFLAAAFAGYQAYVWISDRHRQDALVDKYISAGRKLFLEDGQYENAYAAFVAADKLRQNDPEIQCYLIGSRAAVGTTEKQDLAQAEIQCKFLLEKYPDDAVAHNFVGLVHGWNKNYDEAGKTFSRAIELRGGNYPLAEYNLGKTYAEHAKTFSSQSTPELEKRNHLLKEAIKINDKLVASRPDEVMAIYNTACDFALLGDAEHALKSLERSLSQGYDRYHVIARDSDLDNIREDPKFFQLMRDRYAQIVVKYRGLLETGRSSGEALHVLAWAQLFVQDAKSLEVGVENANRALALNPGNAAYLWTLAQLYAAQGKTKLALEKIELAITKDPSRFYFVRQRDNWRTR